MADGFSGFSLLITRGFVAIQRPVVLVSMSIAAAGFLALGVFAIVRFGQMFLNGDFVVEADAPWWVYIAGPLLIAFGILAPFLLAWLSARYAKMAYRQIREDGLIYRGP